MSVRFVLKNSAQQFFNAANSDLEGGELAINWHESGPYLQCKASDGIIHQLGGVYTGTEAPLNPLPGKFWLDEENQTLYIYGENEWISIAGGGGTPGPPGTAATINVAETETGEPGTNANVVNIGTENAAVLEFTIPRGADGTDGTDGTSATVDVGDTATGAPGTNASVTNSGDTTNAVFDFTIPRGDAGTDGTDGSAATVAVGDTSTGAPGSDAEVTNSGDSSNAIFNFTIPRGDQGEQGTPGTGIKLLGTINYVGPPTDKPDPEDGDLWIDSNGDGWAWDGGEWDNVGPIQGPPGTAATVAVGDTTTGAPGSNAVVTNTGDENAAVLEFTIPRGNKGEDGTDGTDGNAATVAVGSTTTGNPGTNASVTNSGSSSAAVFNFTIPRGAQGAEGPEGPSNPNADTLDGLNSTQFLRSDVADTKEGTTTFTSLATFTSDVEITGSSTKLKLADSNGYSFWIHNNDNRFYVLTDRTGGDEWKTPHPLQLEADTNTSYTFGNRILTTADEGSGNGLDADTLRTSPPSEANTANSIAQRDSNGDVTVRLIRQSHPNQTSISGGLVFRTSTTDNYLRICNNTENIRTFLDVPSKSDIPTQFKYAQALSPTYSSTKNAQGAYIEWNTTSGTGSTYFLNNKGSGGGGWRWESMDYDADRTSQMILGEDSILYGLAKVIATRFQGDADNSLLLGGVAKDRSDVASSIVQRDGNADVIGRLFRSTHPNSGGISGAIAYRVNDSNDNYTRFCSDKAKIRTYLNVQAAGNYVTTDTTQTISAIKTFTARQIISSTGNQLLLHNPGKTSPTFILRNDSNYIYFMLSDASATPNNTFNTLRPLRFDSTTGKVEIEGAEISTAFEVSTIAKRDTNGDINARLFKSNFTNTDTISGALAFRKSTTDNYIRFCNDRPAIRAWLGVLADGANAVSATKLATARTIWGQTFNGTANVSGAMSGCSSAGDTDTGRGRISFTSTSSGSWLGFRSTYNTKGLYRFYKSNVSKYTDLLFDGSTNVSINFPNESGTVALTTSTVSTANNALKLNNISSGSFLRSDETDYKTAGNLRFNDNLRLYVGNGEDFGLFHTGGVNYVDFKNEIRFRKVPTSGSTQTCMQLLQGDNVVVIQNGLGIGATPASNLKGKKAICIGDADTGIRQNGDGTLEWFCNNTNVMIMDKNSIYGQKSVRCNSNSSGTPGFSNTNSGGVMETTGTLFASRASNLAGCFNTNKNGVVISIRKNGAEVGSCYTKSATTSEYRGTSDYRLKTNVLPIDNDIDILKALKPVKFNWKEDMVPDHGFIAHEVQDLIPTSVSGEKDEMEEYGDIYDGDVIAFAEVPEDYLEPEEMVYETRSGRKLSRKWVKRGEKIKPQQMSKDCVVPVLTSVLQKALDRIEQLEAKVNLLEAS